MYNSAPTTSATLYSMHIASALPHNRTAGKSKNCAIIQSTGRAKCLVSLCKIITAYNVKYICFKKLN